MEKPPPQKCPALERLMVVWAGMKYPFSCKVKSLMIKACEGECKLLVRVLGMVLSSSSEDREGRGQIGEMRVEMFEFLS